MPVSFQDPLRDSGKSRSWRYPLAVSLGLHAVLVVVMLTLPARFAREAEKPEPIDIVFYSPAEVERRWIPTPEPPKPPEPEPVQLAEVEPPAPPVEVPPPVARKQPPEPRVEPRSQPVVPKPEPPKRTVRTALFHEETKPDSTAPAPRRMARKGSFAETEPRRPERSDAKPGPARVVAAGRFGSSDLTVPRAARPSRGGSVISTSFDVGEADSQARTRHSGSVKQGGFGSEEVAAPKPRQRKRPADLDTPVSIVSKPKPVYTDEARRLRIEGEVVLEVTFSSSGGLRILRVVGSLGHGLDEAAIAAAKNIEFEPARRNGRPVDHTVTLRVVFRLA